MSVACGFNVGNRNRVGIGVGDGVGDKVGEGGIVGELVKVALAVATGGVRVASMNGVAAWDWHASSRMIIGIKIAALIRPKTFRTVILPL
jgi:hypothetical protein